MSIIRDLSTFKSNNIIFDHNSILYSADKVSFLFLQTPICTVQHIDRATLYITCDEDLCRASEAIDSAYLINNTSYEAFLTACQNTKQSLHFNINGHRNLLKIYSNTAINISMPCKIKLILQPILSNLGIRWTFTQHKVIEDYIEEIEELKEQQAFDTACCLDNELNLVSLPITII